MLANADNLEESFPRLIDSTLAYLAAGMPL
jgi:hypothetical protein